MMKGREMARYSTKEGAPTYHSTSAHSRTANKRVPLNGASRYTNDFRAGLMLGLLIGTAAFLAVLWAWVIPTMDGAVAAAAEAAMLS